MYLKVSPQIVVGTSKSLYYKCQVRGNFCERSEEYDASLVSLVSLASEK